MLHPSLVSLSYALSLAGIAASQSTSQYAADAEAGLTKLQSWYNTTSGLWTTTGWWNAANCLTVLGDLAAVDATVKGTVTNVMSNTFIQAPKTNLQMSKLVTQDFNIITMYSDFPANVTQFPSTVSGLVSGLANVPASIAIPAAVNPQGFLNDYYDDEGWWALAWIQAYDVTGNGDYLTMAEDIFTNMQGGATTPCGGGIWWSKDKTYVAAIANELYLSVASHLANRASNGTAYATVAKNQWTWFQNSGLINAQNTINDGLTDSCDNNNGTVWSYNQGVILGGLVELSTATGDSAYITSANAIANAAITALSSSNDVLHDVCEPNCGADGEQFKGVFMRNLQKLQQASSSQRYLTFIKDNANSIWASDRGGDNGLGVDWDGPYVPADGSTQSSALDALVAAVAVGGGGLGSI